MKIPFYRFVSSDSDGHTTFQCLHCSELLDTIGHDFLYCPYCGIQFKGAILRKYVITKQSPIIQKMFWKIECAILWSKEDTHVEWSVYEMNEYLTAQEAVKIMKEAIKEKQDDMAFIWKFRIVRNILWKNDYITIDTNRYYKKTGKHFPIAKEEWVDRK